MKLEALFITQGAKLDSFQFDITIKEGFHWTNVVPDYPVEIGSPTNSHIIPKADLFDIEGIVTRTPIAVDRESQGRQNYEMASTQLRTLFNQGIVFFVQTSEGPFTNLAIERISQMNTPKTDGHKVYALRLKQFNWTGIGFSNDFQLPTGPPPPAHTAGSVSIGSH